MRSRRVEGPIGPREKQRGSAPAPVRVRKEPEMHVSDLMSAHPICVKSDTPVLEARNLMVSRNIRHLLVVDSQRLAGIVTDRDIRLNLPSRATSLSVWELNYLLAQLTVGAVMTSAVIVVRPDWEAGAAARLMLDHKIGALPVMDGAALVGIVTETDFLRAFVSLVETSAAPR
jgi:acetoin utilization protein AcuB